MIFKEVAPKIYAIESKTAKEVAKIFVRLQENYESPEFRDKVFTLRQFISYYKKFTKKSKFTYYRDWGGFNVPSYIVDRFANGEFGKLRREEKWLLNQIKKANVKGKFYLLGYPKRSAAAKKHEIAHGMFYTLPEYRDDVLRALDDFNMKTHPLAVYLRNIGYHEAVIVDEFHAWILTEKDHLRTHALWDKDLEKLRKWLQHLYWRHS